jgi:hypothetical integral membrane protein (TIGR02206 family)
MGFFSYKPVPESSPYYLQQFSFPHVAAICVLLILAALVIVFRKRLAAWSGEGRLRLAATIVALVFELSLHFITWAEQGWVPFVTNTIPLDLCAVAFWLSVILNASRRRFVYDLLYFWGWGAAASYIYANTDGANWNTWHFYQYFISHGYILLTMTWFTAVRGYHPNLRSLARAVGILFPVTIAIRFFDLAFQGEPWKFNYSFLVSPPDVGTPVSAFGTGWGYYWRFALLGAAILFVAWLPWGIAGAVKRLSSPRPARAAKAG